MGAFLTGVALFCPTSGSTGVPKITAHFHRDVLSIDDTFGKHILRLTPEDVTACTAPLAFTFGLGLLVVFPLRAGACALLTEAVTPRELADIVAKYREWKAVNENLQQARAMQNDAELAEMAQEEILHLEPQLEQLEQLEQSLSLAALDRAGPHRDSIGVRAG